jgi:cell wall-associated NlpC family hydrolase
MKSNSHLVKASSIAGIATTALIAVPGIASASSFNSQIELPSTTAPGIPAHLSKANTSGFDIHSLLKNAVGQVDHSSGVSTLSAKAQRAQSKLAQEEMNFAKFYSREDRLVRSSRTMRASLGLIENKMDRLLGGANVRISTFNGEQNVSQLKFGAALTPSQLVGHHSGQYSALDAKSVKLYHEVREDLGHRVHTLRSEEKIARSEEKLIRKLSPSTRQQISKQVYGETLNNEKLSGIRQLPNYTKSKNPHQARFEKAFQAAALGLEFRTTRRAYVSRKMMLELSKAVKQFDRPLVEADAIQSSTQTNVAQTATSGALSWVFSELGRTYVWGGSGPSVFDCSGLMQYAWRQSGIAIPRTSEEQYNWATPVSLSQLEPGDFVFFEGSDGSMTAPGHVGMYIGGGLMIDAPYTGVDVRIDSIWQKGIVGFGEVPISNITPLGGSGLKAPSKGFITSATSKSPAIYSGSTANPIITQPAGSAPTVPSAPAAPTTPVVKAPGTTTPVAKKHIHHVNHIVLPKTNKNRNHGQQKIDHLKKIGRVLSTPVLHLGNKKKEKLAKVKGITSIIDSKKTKVTKLGTTPATSSPAKTTYVPKIPKVHVSKNSPSPKLPTSLIDN